MTASPARPPITGPAIQALLPPLSEEDEPESELPGVEELLDVGIEDPDSLAKVTFALSLMVDVVFCK